MGLPLEKTALVVLAMIGGVVMSGVILDAATGDQTSYIADDAQPQSEAAAVSGIQDIIWVWFENRETTQITAATAPYFTSFAAANVNLTNFYGVTHPSQPNYLDGFSGSIQGVTNNSYCTFPASTGNLAKQLAAAGKSWRVYAQNFPSPCFDGESSTGGVDGPGLAGQYVRKHNPAISFESVRLDPIQCPNVQPLANFDPTVNFAMVVPNMTNSMHDGTTAQGDAFLQAFVPLVTASPDWDHTLLIVTFDEGTTSINGGGHIYTAAAAPWLPHADVATTYNHFSVLRTIEEVYGLPFLGNAATATTMTELLPSSLTPTPTPTPTATATATATIAPTSTPTPTPTATPLVSISGNISYCSNPVPGPVPSVTMTLAGTSSGSTMTDGSGNYTFSSLASGGNYMVTPTKAALAPGTGNISTVDVIAVQMHFLTETFLSGCELAAADVTGDSKVTTQDVIAVQRFFNGFTSGIANSGQYQFTPVNRTYLGIGSDQTAQNFDTLVFGDVASPFAE